MLNIMCRRFVSYETEMALKEQFLQFNISY